MWNGLALRIAMYLIRLVGKSDKLLEIRKEDTPIPFRRIEYGISHALQLMSKGLHRVQRRRCDELVKFAQRNATVAIGIDRVEERAETVV